MALWSLAALAATALPVASPAHACSGPSCAQTGMLPLAGGSMPANAVQLIWRRSQIFASERASELHLYVVEGGTRRELAFTVASLPGDASGSLYRVVPSTQIAAGSELAVEADELCLAEGAPFTSSLRVGPAAPAPSSLGKLEIESRSQELVPLWVTSGECYRSVKVASVRTRVALSAAAQPYADLLRYELQVDGQPYASQEAAPDWRHQQSPPRIGTSVLGRGAERIYHVCESDAAVPATSGVAEGEHRAQMFALLPDGTRIASDEITLELRCAPATPTGADAGAEEGPTTAVADASSLGAGAQDAGGDLDAGRAGDSASSGIMPAPASDGGAFGQTTDAVRGVRGRTHGEAAHCAPLIGARAGRPLLWVLFVLLLSIVAGRTKKRRHASGSMRQSGRASPPASPPRV
jgi:hypothetical protein